MLPDWPCLLPACVPPALWLAYAGPGHGAIHTSPVSSREDVLQARVLRVTELAGLLRAVPEVQVPGTGKGIVRGPDQEAQPCLGHLPHISPRDGPVDHRLPGCPSTLLVLAHSSDFVALLLHLHNFRDHQVFPVLLCSFGPHLRCCSPFVAGPAWLQQSNNLLMF